MANDDDEMPQLSSATLAALNEWVQEQAELKGGEDRDGAVEMVTEDWRMSQFWYDSETAATVAAEIHHLSKQFSSPRVACVACPSVYVKLKVFALCEIRELAKSCPDYFPGLGTLFEATAVGCRTRIRTWLHSCWNLTQDSRNMGMISRTTTTTILRTCPEHYVLLSR